MTPIISTRVARLHDLDVSANALEDQNHYVPMPKDSCEDPPWYWITIKVGQALPDAAVLRSGKMHIRDLLYIRFNMT